MIIHVFYIYIQSIDRNFCSYISHYNHWIFPSSDRSKRSLRSHIDSFEPAWGVKKIKGKPLYPGCLPLVFMDSTNQWDIFSRPPQHIYWFKAVHRPVYCEMMYLNQNSISGESNQLAFWVAATASEKQRTLNNDPKIHKPKKSHWNLLLPNGNDKSGRENPRHRILSNPFLWVTLPTLPAIHHPAALALRPNFKPKPPWIFAVPWPLLVPGPASSGSDQPASKHGGKWNSDKEWIDRSSN